MIEGKHVPPDYFSEESRMRRGFERKAVKYHTSLVIQLQTLVDWYCEREGLEDNPKDPKDQSPEIRDAMLLLSSISSNEAS